MKKIIGIVLNIVSTLLVGITFGLGGLSFLFAYDKKVNATEALSNSIGNYYEVTWVQGKLNPIMIALFFVLCVAALAITVAMFFNTKKGAVVNCVAALLSLVAGVGMLVANKIYPVGLSVSVPYVLGAGAISMGVLLLVAGVFQVLKVALTIKEE